MFCSNVVGGGGGGGGGGDVGIFFSVMTLMVNMLVMIVTFTFCCDVHAGDDTDDNDASDANTD